jgi:hypothetical protein
MLVVVGKEAKEVKEGVRCGWLYISNLGCGHS